MKKSNRSVWHRTAQGAAMTMALAAVLWALPVAAHAQTCAVGDCNSNGSVTVNEIITLVNIALGTADASTCAAGIPSGATVNVALIIQSVNEVLNGCGVTPTPTPTPGGGTPTCGNGVVDAGEDCDNGGVCAGGSHAGTACTSEADCGGTAEPGICVGSGHNAYNACMSDTDCGGTDKCVRCKTYGGNGCAANCTTESTLAFNLVPGVATGVTIQPGTSGAVVYGDILTIPLPLSGNEGLAVGKTDPTTGLAPLVIKSVNFPQIAVSTIACACVRGIAESTCGGVIKNLDGTLAANCTADYTTGVTCPASAPCAPVFGTGNVGAGLIGCNAGSLTDVDFAISQDSGGSSGVSSPAVTTFSGGAAPAGSVFALSTNAIGTVVGACTGTAADYGADGVFCTDDDPQSSRGTLGAPAPTTTGSASASILNANGNDGDDIGPYTATGVPVTCHAGGTPTASGASLAAGFTELAAPTVGDIAVSFGLTAQ